MLNGPSGTAMDRCANQPSKVLTTAPPESESDSQIRNALCYSEEIAAQLHGEIAAMERRLETGLTPIAPPPAAGTETRGPAPTYGSHILERVGKHNQVIGSAIERLRELRMRVEL